MYYAMTLKDNIITAVHESIEPITSATFAKSPFFADNEVVEVSGRKEYKFGDDIRAYNEDGTLKPLDWRIANGYTKAPEPTTDEVMLELVGLLISQGVIVSV